MKSLIAVILVFVLVVVGAELATDFVPVGGNEKRVEATRVAYDSLSAKKFFSENLTKVESDFKETFGK